MASEEQTEKAHRLMRATGGPEMAKTMFETLLTALRPALRPMPESFWREVRARFDPEELVRLIAPLHADVVPTNDMDELIAFFESAVGQRWIALQPRLTQMGVDVGRQWGARVGREIAERAQ